jgi:diguanylate cyclase (GGDEF)-like protein
MVGLFQHFDNQTACVIGGLIMGLLAAMVMAQAQQLPHYRIPFASLAIGLMFGSFGMYYMANGLEDNDRLSWLFAHMAGTTSYFMVVISLVQLFRPDVKAWKPFLMLSVALIGTLVWSTGPATVIWTQIVRMIFICMAIWVAITTRNRETPFMRRLVFSLSVLGIAAMLPHTMSMVQDWQLVHKFYSNGDPTATLQTVSWIVSAIMSHVTITAVVQGRIASRLSYAADYDSLTKVNNRRALMRQGEALLGNASPALLLLDVDHFKKINDTYGHLAGDAVLTHIAQVIKQAVRDEDSVVGRYGGEEFCIMLREASPEHSALVAERVRAALEANPYKSSDALIKVEASIGLAPLTKGQSLEQWISRADKCLYDAKVSGRNRVSQSFPMISNAGVGFVV